MTAAAGGWSPLRMPARPAWWGTTRPPVRNKPQPIVCDPPYMYVCPGNGSRCRARSIIPRHLPHCPACGENGEQS
jgi:hypothetical protein